MFIESNIPLNKGVSSSAAIAVAVMKAASSAYGSVLEGIELAECCQWAENTIAESPCGIMDQAVVVLGEEGCLLPLLCQPCLPQPPVALPEALEYRAVDCGVSHSVAGPECENLRAAAFMGYKLICDQEHVDVEPDKAASIPRWTDERWSGYLSNVDPAEFRSNYELLLPEDMTGAEYLRAAFVHVDSVTSIRPEVRYPVRAASRYAVEEHRRNRHFIDLARRAGTNPEFELMGDLMYQSHAAYTECGLGCDATDAIVEFVRNEGPTLGLYGARITGGGAGGTVAVLSRRGAREAFDRAVSRYAEHSGFAPHVFEGSSPGADRFGIETM